MTNLFLIVSMVLNGIALFSIVILYLRQNRFLQVEKKHEKLLKEMEEVISSYLLEMTEENEKFIHKVRELISKQQILINSENSKQEHELTRENENREPSNEKSESTKGQPPFRKGTVFQAVQAYNNTNSKDVKVADKEPLLPPLVSEQPPLIKEKKSEDKPADDLYTQSFYYQVLLLQKQGLSTEEIAKKLKKGKTEIELLLKLRQNGKQ